EAASAAGRRGGRRAGLRRAEAVGVMKLTTRIAKLLGRLDVDEFLRRFDEMDARLVRLGFHATSPWWRAELERFLRSGRHRWVLRVGRRGGKSSFLCRLAIAWALWGPW